MLRYAVVSPVPERDFTLRRPDRFDRVFVRAYGPRDAGTILVLTRLDGTDDGQ